MTARSRGWLLGLTLGLLILLVAPAGATNVTPYDYNLVGETRHDIGSVSQFEFDATEEGRVVSRISVSASPHDTPISFSLVRGSESYSGSILYRSELLHYFVTETLGTDSYSYDQYAVLHIEKTFFIRYGKNSDTELTGLIVDTWELFSLPPQGAFAYVRDIERSPIERVSLSSDHDFSVTLWTIPADEFYSQHTSRPASVTELVSVLWGFITNVGSILILALYIFKLIIVDYFISLLVLVELLILGYAVGSARRPRDFVRTVTYYNEKYLGYLAGFIRWIVDLLYRLVQALKPL